MWLRGQLPSFPERVPNSEMGEQTYVDGGTSRLQGKKVPCECGALLAMLTPDGIEIKCRRCKRVVSIPIAELRKREVVLFP